MGVPKGKRKLSRFEAQHHFYRLRTEITSLMLNDFGFSPEKYQKAILRYKEIHKSALNVDEVVARYEKKCQSFSKWFIDRECDAVSVLLRNIETEFSVGNSIYPSETPAKLMEFLTRRWHMNRAIGYCYALKQELNYVIRVLPVDINKFERFSDAIDKQIALYRGVRQSDNRLIKPKAKQNESLAKGFYDICDGFSSVIWNIRKMAESKTEDDK